MKNYTFIITVCLVLLSCNKQNPNISEQDINHILNQEIPIGTSYEDVHKFFKSNKYEYSWVEKDNSFYSIVRNVSGGNIIIKKSLRIIIRLDETKTVSMVEVKPGYTGP